MLLTANNLILPHYPDGHFWSPVPIAFAILAAVALVWVIIFALLKQEAATITFVMVVIVAIIGVFTSNIMVDYINKQHYEVAAQAKTEAWIKHHYAQHFSKQQLDDLSWGLSLANPSYDNEDVERYGTTDLLSNDNKIVTVQLVKLRGQYKVLKVAKQSLEAELPTK